jgi:hypothetical protein
MLNHDFQLKFSKTYFVLLSSVGVASIFSLFFSRLNAGVGILLALGIVLYSYEIARKYVFLTHSSALQMISKRIGQDWEIVMGKKRYTASLLGESLITSLLLVMRFRREDNKKVYIAVIWRDSLQKDLFRQLFIWASGNAYH